MRKRALSGKSLCDFCGDWAEPKDYVQGPTVGICRQCVELAAEFLRAGENEEKEKKDGA